MNVGDTVRSYVIETEVSRGSYCDSFIVRKGTSQYFLKEYGDPTEMSSDFKPFYANQKKIASLLSRLGGVTEEIVEHFVYDGRYYQVKKLLRGENMDDWMNRVTDIKPRMEAAIFLTQIIRAIHSVNIVHQDLKPAQVMVVSESPVRLVLTDFDWAFPDGKIVRPVATPWYAWPDSRPTKQSDIFTLGIMLCVLLTGDNPYRHNGELEDQWVRWVKGKKYREPIDLNPDDVTPKINEIIVRCLSPESDKRPSLEEILDVLKNPIPALPVKRLARLVSGSAMMVIPVGARVDRQDFKICFPSVKDSAGNPIYMYVSGGVTALTVTRDGDKLMISSPDGMTNKFKLNGRDITAVPVEINDGDTIQLYSIRQSKVVAAFSVQLA